MTGTLRRVLKHCLIGAIVSYLTGVVLAEAVALYFESQLSNPEWSEPIVRKLRRQIPLGMVAWSIALVVLFETLALIFKKTPLPPPAESPRPTQDAIWKDIQNRIHPPLPPS